MWYNFSLHTLTQPPPHHVWYKLKSQKQVCVCTSVYVCVFACMHMQYIHSIHVHVHVCAALSAYFPASLLGNLYSCSPSASCPCFDWLPRAPPPFFFCFFIFIQDVYKPVILTWFILYGSQGSRQGKRPKKAITSVLTMSSHLKIAEQKQEEDQKAAA